MTFCVEDRSSFSLGLDYEEIFERVASKVLELEGCPYEAEVSLSLVDASEIRDLNNQYRGVDAVTDVLSFPGMELPFPADFSRAEEDYPDCFNPESGEIVLGDIVICPERAAAQAEEYGHSREREYAFLIAHSMLHLLGFDHMEEAQEERMVREQKRCLDSLGIGR